MGISYFTRSTFKHLFLPVNGTIIVSEKQEEEKLFSCLIEERRGEREERGEREHAGTGYYMRSIHTSLTQLTHTKIHTQHTYSI